MTVKDLIEKLSALDGNADVVIRTGNYDRFDGRYLVKNVDVFSSVNSVYLYSEELENELEEFSDNMIELEEENTDLESELDKYEIEKED